MMSISFIISSTMSLVSRWVWSVFTAYHFLDSLCCARATVPMLPRPIVTSIV